jgi:hypothetical protein
VLLGVAASVGTEPRGSAEAVAASVVGASVFCASFSGAASLPQATKTTKLRALRDLLIAIRVEGSAPDYLAARTTRERGDVCGLRGERVDRSEETRIRPPAVPPC